MAMSVGTRLGLYEGCGQLGAYGMARSTAHATHDCNAIQTATAAEVTRQTDRGLTWVLTPIRRGHPVRIPVA
jgi:hypothetical protein